MSSLGTVTIRTTTPKPAPKVIISRYEVKRGSYLGALTIHTPRPFVSRQATLENYVVRQLSIVYRQLWPYYGQRFPQ